MKKKILLGLTTITKDEWKNKVKEIDKLGLEEIALFPTCLNFKERQELYQLLENTKLISIPHVHLKNDMENWELDYLNKKFKTEIFNIHSNKNAHSFTNDYGRHIPNIYVENTDFVPETEELKKSGGLCIDFSHWQDAILKNEQEYILKMEKSIRKFKTGCSHISAVAHTMEKILDIQFPEIIYEGYCRHMLSNLNEMDYIKNFIKYLPEFISIELENSFEEQLEVKKYLEKIVNY